MSKEKINLYFLGSGKIAIPVIDILTKSNIIDFAGIGTQTDQPFGRNKILTPTPIGQWAKDRQIRIDKISNVNSVEFLDKLKSLNPDIILVISFGQLLKKEILALPKFKCINIHASLLPLYRGASPISATILNGDLETGITFMEMTEGLDSGPIFQLYPYKLNGHENASDLEEELGKLAAQYVEEIVEKIYTKQIIAVPQNDNNATYVKKLKKQGGQINWNDDATKIERMARAFYPWPGIFFNLKTEKGIRKISITKLGVSSEYNGQPGTIIKADKHQWIIACGKSAIELKKIIPEGKAEMTGSEFLMGCKLTEGISVII